MTPKSNKKSIDTAGDGGEVADDTIIRNMTGTLLLDATMMTGGALRGTSYLISPVKLVGPSKTDPG